MKFNFDKERFLQQRGVKSLSAKELRGAYPIFLFYAKENDESNVFDILHFDWGMSSKVRPMTDQDANDKVTRYNPKWVMANELTAEIINDTTHLITGYYNLITDEWNEIERKEIKKVTESNLFNVLFKTEKICSTLFYDDKALYLHNLKIAAKNNHSAFLCHEDLSDNLIMQDFMEMLIDWFTNNKEEVSVHTTSIKNITVPIKRIKDYLDKSNVPELDENGEQNISHLLAVMRAHDMFQSGIYNKKTKEVFAEKDFQKIDKEDLKNNMTDYTLISLFNERFIHNFVELTLNK